MLFNHDNNICCSVYGYVIEFEKYNMCKIVEMEWIIRLLMNVKRLLIIVIACSVILVIIKTTDIGYKEERVQITERIVKNDRNICGNKSNQINCTTDRALEERVQITEIIVRKDKNICGNKNNPINRTENNYYFSERNVQQLYAASQNRSFYTPEVAEKLLKSLAELVQHRIELSQNPVNCDGRRIITHLIATSGYGSEIKRLVHSLMNAFYQGKVFILKSKGWLHNLGGWEAFHMPLSNCTALNSKWVYNVTHSKHFDKRPRSGREIASIPADIAPLLVTLHPRPFMWWHAQFVKYATRLQPWVEDTIARRRKQLFEHGFSKPFVGLHIRRGDKVAEARMVPTKDYMNQAELYFQTTDGKLNDTQRRQIYLATDDENVYSEIQSQYPHYDIFVYTTQQNNSYGPDNLQQIIADLIFLTEADLIVCTFSSNICRRVLEYRQGVSYRDMSDTVVSVDGYYFIMGFKELRVATHNRLVKHESNSTLTFRKGDFIETTYKDFVHFPPGIEYGINIRTGITGKYNTTDTVYYTRVREWPNFECPGQLNKYIKSLHGRI